MNPADEMNVDEAIVHIRIVEINQEKPKFIIPSTPNATVEIPEVKQQQQQIILRYEEWEHKITLRANREKLIMSISLIMFLVGFIIIMCLRNLH